MMQNLHLFIILYFTEVNSVSHTCKNTPSLQITGGESKSASTCIKLLHKQAEKHSILNSTESDTVDNKCACLVQICSIVKVEKFDKETFVLTKTAASKGGADLNPLSAASSMIIHQYLHVRHSRSGGEFPDCSGQYPNLWERRWSAVMNHTFFYIMRTTKCVCRLSGEKMAPGCTVGGHKGNLHSIRQVGVML